MVFLFYNIQIKEETVWIYIIFVKKSQIDDQYLSLLEERMHLVEGVVAYKKASGKPRF